MFCKYWYWMLLVDSCWFPHLLDLFVGVYFLLLLLWLSRLFFLFYFIETLHHQSQKLSWWCSITTLHIQPQYQSYSAHMDYVPSQSMGPRRPCGWWVIVLACFTHHRKKKSNCLTPFLNPISPPSWSRHHFITWFWFPLHPLQIQITWLH